MDLDSVRSEFNELDQDHSGAITKKEFIQVIAGELGTEGKGSV
jgi:Ca2+-binding EF-hand superfamily protein